MDSEGTGGTLRLRSNPSGQPLASISSATSSASRAAGPNSRQPKSAALTAMAGRPSMVPSIAAATVPE